MDEQSFRTGRNADGSSIEHGVDPEVARLHTRVAYLEEELSKLRKFHYYRIGELLAANNREVERRREAERAAERRGIKRDG